MNEILDLITKLRHELEACRTGENDTNVMDAIQTVNKIENKLLRQANGVQASEATAILPLVSISGCKANRQNGDRCGKYGGECSEEFCDYWQPEC